MDYIGSPDTPHKTEEAIRSSGGKMIAVPADISKPEEVQHLIDTAANEFGRLDMIVNNAGIEKKGNYTLNKARVVKQAGLIKHRSVAV